MSCLTVGSKHWLRKRRRFLLGRERMALQGIVVGKHAQALAETSEGSLRLLSGNCVNFFNMSQGLAAGMATLDPKYFLG